MIACWLCVRLSIFCMMFLLHFVNDVVQMVFIHCAFLFCLVS